MKVYELRYSSLTRAGTISIAESGRESGLTARVRRSPIRFALMIIGVVVGSFLSFGFAAAIADAYRLSDTTMTVIAFVILPILTLPVAVFLVPRRHIHLWANDNGARPILRIVQSNRLQLLKAEFTILNEDGQTVGAVSRQVTGKYRVTRSSDELECASSPAASDRPVGVRSTAVYQPRTGDEIAVVESNRGAMTWRLRFLIEPIDESLERTALCLALVMVQLSREEMK